MVMPYNNDYFFDNEIDSDYEWLKNKSPKKISPEEPPPLLSIKKSLRKKIKRSPQKIEREKKEPIIFSENKFDDDEFDNDYPWLKKGKKEEGETVKKSPKKIIKSDWSRITLEDYVDDFEYYSKVPDVAIPVAVPPPLVPPPLVPPPLVRVPPPPILRTTGSTSRTVSGALGSAARTAGGAIASIATTAGGVVGSAVRSAGGAIASTSTAATGLVGSAARSAGGAIASTSTAALGALASGAYGTVRNWMTPAPALPPIPRTISLTIQPIVHKSLPKISIKTIGDKSIMTRAWNYMGSFFPTRNATITLSLIPIVNTTVFTNLQIQVTGQLSIIPIVNEVIAPLQIKVTDVLSIFPVVNDSINLLNIIVSPPLPLAIPSLNIQPVINQTMNAVELLVTYTIPILPIVNQNLPNVELDTIEFVERIINTNTNLSKFNLLWRLFSFFILIYILLSYGKKLGDLNIPQIAENLNVAKYVDNFNEKIVSNVSNIIPMTNSTTETQIVTQNNRYIDIPFTIWEKTVQYYQTFVSPNNATEITTVPFPITQSQEKLNNTTIIVNSKQKQYLYENMCHYLADLFENNYLITDISQDEIKNKLDIIFSVGGNTTLVGDLSLNTTIDEEKGFYDALEEAKEEKVKEAEEEKVKEAEEEKVKEVEEEKVEEAEEEKVKETEEEKVKEAEDDSTYEDALQDPETEEEKLKTFLLEMKIPEILIESIIKNKTLVANTSDPIDINDWNAKLNTYHQIYNHFAKLDEKIEDDINTIQWSDELEKLCDKAGFGSFEDHPNNITEFFEKVYNPQKKEDGAKADKKLIESNQNINIRQTRKKRYSPYKPRSKKQHNATRMPDVITMPTEPTIPTETNVPTEADVPYVITMPTEPTTIPTETNVPNVPTEDDVPYVISMPNETTTPTVLEIIDDDCFNSNIKQIIKYLAIAGFLTLAAYYVNAFDISPEEIPEFNSLNPLIVPTRNSLLTTLPISVPDLPVSLPTSISSLPISFPTSFPGDEFSWCRQSIEQAALTCKEIVSQKIAYLELIKQKTKEIVLNLNVFYKTQKLVNKLFENVNENLNLIISKIPKGICSFPPQCNFKDGRKLERKSRKISPKKTERSDKKKRSQKVKKKSRAVSTKKSKKNIIYKFKNV
jgi:hypothetical protein